MKDSSVGPAGLFDISRGRRLLFSLATRSHWWAERQSLLVQEHRTQQTDDDVRLDAKRSEVALHCRQLRRETLSQWDDVEENLTCQYEMAAVKVRQDLSRLTAIYRRKLADERKAIEQKVEERRQAVIAHYESQKPLPGQQRRKEITTIDSLLVPLREEIESARQLTILRLEQLPELAPDAGAQEYPEPKINTVAESIASIEQLTASCREVITLMRRGAASGLVYWLYVPLAVLAFVSVWAGLAYLFAPSPPWLVMGVGVPIGGVLWFITYIVLQRPLNRMTRDLYPKVERIGRVAQTCAESGRRISTRIASETSAELVQRRDGLLDAAHKWKVERLAEMESRLASEERDARNRLEKHATVIDEQFNDAMSQQGTEMRGRADATALTITQKLAEIDQQLQQEREASELRRREQMCQLHERLKQGLSRGLRRILQTNERVNTRFPPWPVVNQGEHPVAAGVDFLPIGHLLVAEHLRELLELKDDPYPTGSNGDTPAVANDYSPRTTVAIDGQSIPSLLPVVLHRRLHSGLVITCPSLQLTAAIEVVHQMLWRLLTASKPARAKLTLIDPIGRGQHFTSFMALADHDPGIVNHRVWTTESKIEARLGELAHHVEDILQTFLRDRFERIEDYNELAGSMSEPFRAIAAIGLPEGLSREGYRHLRALLESGNRCGTMTLMVCDESKPWPNDMPLPAADRLLRIRVDESGQWRVEYDGLDAFAFQPASSPPSSMRNHLVEQIGKAAAAAARVEIPLENILPLGISGQANTDDGIEIPIGSQGANRTLSLTLGEGVRQHTLIAGKTGSGKSTLLHAIITAGMYQFRPSQLQFYLLDFKKGVEFKPYADSGVPHMRVVGIESEREFGLSVLQRLDAELQQRGELFRGAAVQELGDYRQATGKDLPRLMLVVDEFQELFLRDDRLAGDCAMLLDRLVRQGRSFGMHVVLSSQSLAGAYSLPRATLGQMAVRIAMQCSEADAAMILADDNTAARLLSRPGEAIYNDAGGLAEGNQPFQVAWLTNEQHQEMLLAVAARDSDCSENYPPTVVFEGNRPAKWSTVLAGSVSDGNSPGGALCGLLGEAVEIGPPVSLRLSRDAGRNVLLLSSGNNKSAVLASLVTCIAKGNGELSVVYLDGSRVDDTPSMAPWLSDAGVAVETIKPRDSETRLRSLVETISQRGDAAEDVAPVILVIDPLDRFRDLRQDESFSFSLDAASGVSAAAALQTILRDGPAARVFTILVCNGTETLTRWLPRASQHDLELRVLGVMNASDSAMLIDSPAASDLSAATMLVYDDADGKLTKFRYINQPDAAVVKNWLCS